MADLRRRRRAAPPGARRGDPERAARRAHPRLPAGVEPGRLRRRARRRRARPQDPRLARRRPERRRRSSSRSPARSAPYDEPLVRDLVAVAATTTSRSSWCGARRPAPTTPGTAAARRRAARVPHLRQLRAGGAGLRRLLPPSPVRYRSPVRRRTREALPAARRRARMLEAAEPGAALSEHASKQVLRAYGIRVSKDVLCESATAAVEGGGGARLPGRDEGVVAGPAAQERAGLVRLGVGVGAGGARAYDELVAAATRAEPDRRGSKACSCARGHRRRRDGGRRLP